MTQLDRIQLVVLSHNRMDRLPVLLHELLLPAASRGVEVTIVDNASEPAVREFLDEFSGTNNLDIVFSEENSGVAKGRNLGFRRSQREFAVYLDDDSMMHMEALERVPQIFDEIADVGVLAFQVVHGFSGQLQNEHGAERVEVGNFHGAGHAIRRTVFERIGYLDEACFFGAEEIEFTMRALANGIKTLFVPEILVEHFSMPRVSNERLYRSLYWVRNYAMVLFRYLPPRIALLFSFRLLVSHLISTFHTCKLAMPLIPLAMTAGALKGTASRNPLTAQGVAFYRDPNTRPELGNVSILSKLRRSLFSAP
jgi:GT2 family glycosyltransferase